MGGKQAKERRRLKRIQEASKSKETISTLISEKKDTSSLSTASISTNNIKRRKTGTVQHVKNEHKENHSKTKFSYNNGMNKTLGTKIHKKKINTKFDLKAKKKKPKHLKRKLENAIKENDVEAKLKVEQMMLQLEKDKKHRNELFEARVKKIAGDSFNKELFQSLIQKGASQKTILDSMTVEGKDQIENSGTSLEQTKKETTEEKVKDEEIDTKNKNNKSASKAPSQHDEETETIQSKFEDAKVQLRNQVNETKKETFENLPSQTIPSVSSSSSHKEKKFSNSDSISSGSSSSDEESLPDIPNKRTRGKKRKNQKEADQKRALQNQKEIELLQQQEKLEPPLASPAPTPKPKVRRCIGRKPVTDFEIGKRYKGKVVYIKPFGAFIDIMCHSDAFCHVSRVQDAYVEDIESVLKVDQEVNPRVVEIDREKRRITVSLQSDERREDEIWSAREKKERVEKRKLEKEEKKKMKQLNQNAAANDSNDASWETNEQNNNIEDLNEESNNLIVLKKMDKSQMTQEQMKRLRKLQRREERRQQNETEAEKNDNSTPVVNNLLTQSVDSGETNNLTVLESMDESQMTSAQLKQLRKLRRRSERRAQKALAEKVST